MNQTARFFLLFGLALLCISMVHSGVSNAEFEPEAAEANPYASLASLPSEEDREPLPCLDRRFSIVAHIVRDSLGEEGTSPGQIEAALAAVDGAFEDICVSFEVCEVRYIDNFQYDTLVFATEWGQALTNYHQENRINMFFVNNIDQDPGICGKASLGGIANTSGGGIAIVNSCVGFGTIAHEMGHYFGLLHTFEGSGIELADGSNCETAGDQICDTPADPYNEDDPISLYADGCEFTYMELDANGDFYDPHVGNIMSYYPCACEFSYDQYQRMAATYLGSNPKMW